MTKTPTNTSTRLCEYKCMLCLPSDRIVKASKTTYDALKSHIKTHHSVKEGEFKALIGQRPNQNKRRRDSAGIVSSPSSKQKSIADYRGLQWGKPGQPVSKKEMDDDIVDSFVECMLPLVVSSVFIPPPPCNSVFGSF